MAFDLVGLPGLEPGTSSLSECRPSGFSRDIDVVTWAYARWASSGYLVVSCAYPRHPQRSRAVVGPSLGIVDHQIRSSGHIVQDRPSWSVPWADIPEWSAHVRRCPAAWQQYWQQSRRDGADPD